MIKYQGLARNSNGNPITNQSISLRISLHQGSAGGTVVYKETHSTITNAFGMFSINVLAGTVVSGSLNAIHLNSSSYFQEVEMDITGGSNYTSMGTSQWLSVPYALNSANAGFSNFQVFDASGNYTVPPGVTKIMIEIWGGGGAGGGTSGSGIGGSGGGAGAYGKEIFGVNAGNNIVVSVGAGGSGVVDANGTSGGGSSSNALITASGGTGGLRGNGGGGGGNSSAAFNIIGGTGSNGSNANFPGSGGSAGQGGSGAPGGGNAGTSPGGGGSGTGIDGTAGGNGANGRVVIWW